MTTDLQVRKRIGHCWETLFSYFYQAVFPSENMLDQEGFPTVSNCVKPQFVHPECAQKAYCKPYRSNFEGS